LETAGGELCGGAQRPREQRGQRRELRERCRKALTGELGGIVPSRGSKVQPRADPDRPVSCAPHAEPAPSIAVARRAGAGRGRHSGDSCRGSSFLAPKRRGRCCSWQGKHGAGGWERGWERDWVLQKYPEAGLWEQPALERCVRGRGFLEAPEHGVAAWSQRWLRHRGLCKAAALLSPVKPAWTCSPPSRGPADPPRGSWLWRRGGPRPPRVGGRGWGAAGGRAQPLSQRSLAAPAVGDAPRGPPRPPCRSPESPLSRYWALGQGGVTRGHARLHRS